MRPLAIEVHDTNQLLDAIREIIDASQEDIARNVFDELVVSNVTVSRTIDCSSATLGELRDFVGTIVQDIQNRRT